MKTLRHWAWSLVLIGMAFGQAKGDEVRAPGGPFFCESGSYCFIDGALTDSYRKISLSECSARRQPLSAYGLAKQVSAWVNNSDWLVIVEDAYGNVLWRELPHTRSSAVEQDGDQAWYFRCLGR